MGVAAFCSGPFWADTARVRELATGELVRAAARALADALQTPPNQAHPALCAALHHMAGVPSFGRRTWAPSVGRALRVASEHDGTAVRLAAINLVLDFLESAAPLRCRVRLARPERVRVDPFVLPPSPWVSIDWHAPTLVLETRHATATLTIEPSGRRVEDLCVDRLDAMALFEDLGRIALLRGESGGCFPPLDEPGGAADDGVLGKEIAGAGQCLERCAPRYVDWIFPMVGYAVPVAAPEGRFASGSARDAPGVISLSPGAGPIKVAESLVHEAAHQYYFLLSRFARLTDDTPGKHYHSPLVDRERPLDKILQAFHAAANVVSFYTLLEQSSEWRPAYRADLDHGIDDCRILASHLRDNPGLCEAGLDLYQPIHDWLAERGLVS